METACQESEQTPRTRGIFTEPYDRQLVIASAGNSTKITRIEENLFVHLRNK